MNVATELKAIWQSSDADMAQEHANVFIYKYEKRFPQAVQCLEDGLEDSLMFYAYPSLDFRKNIV